MSVGAVTTSAINATEALTATLSTATTVNKNGAASVSDGTPIDTLYLIASGLFAFAALQVGLALREVGAARPHAAHELLKKNVRCSHDPWIVSPPPTDTGIYFSPFFFSFFFFVCSCWC